MLLLKWLTGLVGLALLILGYLIYFEKKYYLINDFEAAKRAGSKTERYAQTVGKVEMLLGAALLAICLILSITA